MERGIPFMFYIIANETSGSGLGARVLEQVKKVLEDRGLEYEVHTTKGSGDAGKLSDEACKSWKTDIVCLGGDGNNFEIVNGLAGRFASLYFVPCGTGNDFVKMLNLSKDPIEAFQEQLDGKPVRIDEGQLNDYHFLNVSGTGFDVDVLKRASAFKRLGKGILPYLLGIFAALRHFQPMQVVLTVDGKTEKQKVTLISIGNGSYFGGGMKAVPHSRINDGLFDVIIAKEFGRLKILQLLGKFISGRHVGMEGVREFRCREITIRCPGMVMDIDGELIEMDEAHYRILPGALEIHLPKGTQSLTEGNGD